MLPGLGFFLFWKKQEQTHHWGPPGCSDNFAKDTLQIRNAGEIYLP